MRYITKKHICSASAVALLFAGAALARPHVRHTKAGRETMPIAGQSQKLMHWVNPNSVSSSASRHPSVGKLELSGVGWVDFYRNNSDTLSPKAASPKYSSLDERNELVSFDESKVWSSQLKLGSRMMMTWQKGILKSHMGFAYEELDGARFFDVSEAWVMLGDLNTSPVYFLGGKKYLGFGNYDPKKLVKTLPQMLAEANETVFEVGYANENGFHGSVAAFNGTKSQNDSQSRINNAFVRAGYSGGVKNVDYDVDVSYLKDVRDSSLMIHQASKLSPNRRIAGYAFHVGGKTGPFAAGLDWVGYGKAIIEAKTRTKPWALDFGLNYAFDMQGYAS